jgi:hypothetical protein
MALMTMWSLVKSFQSLYIASALDTIQNNDMIPIIPTGHEDLSPASPDKNPNPESITTVKPNIDVTVEEESVKVPTTTSPERTNGISMKAAVENRNVEHRTSALSRIQNATIPVQLERLVPSAKLVVSALNTTKAEPIALQGPSKHKKETFPKRIGKNDVFRRRGNYHNFTVPADPAWLQPTIVKGTTLPGPIFVMSLPKSGTSSVFKFFKCGKVQSSHGYAKVPNGKISRLGYIWGANAGAGRPLLQDSGNVSVWTDEGIVDSKRGCFYPSLDALENIYHYYPTATIMISVRERRSWLESARNFNGLIGRWEHHCPDFPRVRATTEEWLTFYDYHTAYVRQFAEQHRSLTYIEVPLEAPSSLMESLTGVKASCWKHCNPISHKCEQIKGSLSAAALSKKVVTYFPNETHSIPVNLES